MTFYYVWETDTCLGKVAAPNFKIAWKRAREDFQTATHIEEK